MYQKLQLLISGLELQIWENFEYSTRENVSQIPCSSAPNGGWLTNTYAATNINKKMEA